MCGKYKVRDEHVHLPHVLSNSLPHNHSCPARHLLQRDVSTLFTSALSAKAAQPGPGPVAHRSTSWPWHCF